MKSDGDIASDELLVVVALFEELDPVEPIAEVLMLFVSASPRK